MRRGVGRKTILKDLLKKLTMGPDQFNCDGVQQERVVQTNFYGLETELQKLHDLGNKEDDPHSWQVKDAADRLALVIDDLKKRSTTPTTYVCDKIRIWKNTWVMPLVEELLAKEKS